MKKNCKFFVTMSLISLFLTSCTKYYKGSKSDHFDGTRFYDPELDDKKTLLSLLKWQLNGQAKKWPDTLPLDEKDTPPSKVEGDELRITNVGHATFLIQTQGVNILTDPVWSKRASPLSFIGPKRVVEPGIDFENLPPIDIIWVSHNHYDHLDLRTINRLWEAHSPRVITPLGNDAIIQSYNKNIVVETYDWGDSVKINEGMTFHLSAAQHWSSRGIFDRNKALWAALTIETKSGNVYFIGDSGYGNGRYFKKDQKKFGRYRLAILPMGAYEPRWFMKYAHMNPEEFALAHLDLNASISIPSHYDVFRLTDEGLGEASEALKEATKKHNIETSILQLKVGQGKYIEKLVINSSP